MSLNLSIGAFRRLYDSNIKFTGSAKKGKKDISDAVNEETIEKVKQYAIRDAINGKQSKEKTIFMHQCREKVAPNRDKIFNEAERKVSQESKKHGEKSYTNIYALWEYLIKIDGKTEGGSFKGEYSSADGHTFIEAFDENGESIGTYDSKSGWSITYTSLEEQAYGTLTTIYNETFREIYKSTHGKNGNTASYQSESRLNVTA